MPSAPSPIQRYLPAILALAAIAYGIAMAVQRRWVCDDAFISYRYAQNMLDGKGLVFNQGEYVEGYSNFLWTMLCAAGMALGVSAETWSIVWGILFFSLSLALLAWHFQFLRRITGSACGIIPIAVLLAAAHQDWTIYATSGLETSAYTFFLILGYALLVRGTCDPAPSIRIPHSAFRNSSLRASVPSCLRAFIIGLVFTCATLTRPDGALFALIAAVILLALPHTRGKPLIGYSLGFAVPIAIFMIWKKCYYGDWLPNTYYAKSANLAWWDQGWHYLRLYFTKYVALLAAIPPLLTALARWARPGETSESKLLRRITFIAAAFAIPYTLYVTRLGGDFMFARLLIPVTPFYIILIELALAAWPHQSRARKEAPRNRSMTNETDEHPPSFPVWRTAIAIALVFALILPPYPMTNFDRPHGIANEWKFYRQARPLLDESKDNQAILLKKYCTGLPIRIAFLGAEAHAMYRARVPVAIEAEAGLTDRFIAHQPLAHRGRVGHEKNAPLSYLTETRKVHLTISPEAPGVLKLTREILEKPIMLDGAIGWVVTWDPPIMEELKRRGARFLDIPREIETLISRLPQIPDDQLRATYTQLRHIYFDHISDPARENPIRAKLGLPPKS